MTQILFFFMASATQLVFAFGLENSFPFQETKCKFGSIELRLDRKTESSNASVRAPLVFLNGKSNHAVKPETPGNGFTFAKVQGDSACAETQAYQLGNTTYAVLISQDDRSDQATYHAVIYDLKKDKILAVKNLDSVVEYFKIKNGFAYAVAFPQTDADTKNLTSTTGKALSASDHDLGAFQSVVMKNGKLVTGYDPDLSFEKSKWKKYFKSKSDYLKATGWNEKTRVMKNLVVYHGQNFSRKESDVLDSCIALTDKRGGSFESQTQRCLQEKQ